MLLRQSFMSRNISVLPYNSVPLVDSSLNCLWSFCKCHCNCLLSQITSYHCCWSDYQRYVLLSVSGSYYLAFKNCYTFNCSHCIYCWSQLFSHNYVSTEVFVTGFWKTDPNRTFGISRITNLKYLTHCESLLLGCSHAIFAIQLQ